MLLLPTSTDLFSIFSQLAIPGAASKKILSEEFRLTLLEEAQGYPYTPLPEVVGEGENIVRQQMFRFNDFPKDSQFILLKDSFQAWFAGELTQLDEYPFEYPLDLNTCELVKYEAGSLGITPHRDGFRYKNLICVFIIGGRGRFYTCSDRSGTDAFEIDAAPGKVILMRAPGFLGRKGRPFHFVKDIQSTRYVFGLRQKLQDVRQVSKPADA
jgi:hypothetical protein